MTSDISRSKGVLLIGPNRPDVVGMDRRPASPRRPRLAACGSMERLEFRLLGFPEFRLNGRRSYLKRIEILPPGPL